MSSKYKVGDDALPHYVTFTVVGWIDVFSHERYKEIIIKSLDYCITSKGLILHAWVIMANHINLIISSKTTRIEYLVRDMKKYTSKKIITAMQDNNSESRREWMINIYNFAGKSNSNIKEFQFWKQDYHPVELDTPVKLNQRLDYLHENEVRSGLIWEPWHFKYSSAIDY